MSVAGTLADIVLAAQLATGPAVARAARHADISKQPLVVAVIRELGVDELALAEALAAALRMALVDPAALHPELDALRALARDVSRRLRALPIALREGPHRVLEVAMADPTDLAALVELEAVTGCEIAVTLVPLSAVESAIEAAYRALVTEVVPRKQPFGASLGVATQPLARAPATVPYHRVSDEADLAVRHQALVRLLLDRHVISEDEYEDAVRELLKRRDEGG